jgi:hypothetical protein
MEHRQELLKPTELMNDYNVDIVNSCHVSVRPFERSYLRTAELF